MECALNALLLPKCASFSCALVTTTFIIANMASAQISPHVFGAQNHEQHCQALVGGINASAVSAQQQAAHDRKPWQAESRSRYCCAPYKYIHPSKGCEANDARQHSPTKGDRSWIDFHEWICPTHFISSRMSLLPRFPRSSGSVPYVEKSMCVKRADSKRIHKLRGLTANAHIHITHPKEAGHAH